LVSPSDPVRPSSSHASIRTPERQSISSLNTQDAGSAPVSTGRESRSLGQTEPAQNRACMGQLDVSIPNISRPEKSSNYRIPSAVAWVNIFGGLGTPTSAHGQEPISQDSLSSGQSYLNARAHSNSPWQQSGSAIADVAYGVPHVFTESFADRPSFDVNLQGMANPFDGIDHYSSNTLFTPPDNPTWIPFAPAPDPPNAEADIPEPEDPPELRCDAEGCDASFTGTYRNGNLGRHRRQKHADLKSYECEAVGCDAIYSRQDARLKHYRASHPELASSHTVRKLDPMRCPHGCPATFDRTGEYRRHMIIHERPRYRCPLVDCTKTFSRADKLRDHAKKGHGGGNPFGL